MSRTGGMNGKGGTDLVYIRPEMRELYWRRKKEVTESGDKTWAQYLIGLIIKDLEDIRGRASPNTRNQTQIRHRAGA
jgi:hypothetical protein